MEDVRKRSETYKNPRHHFHAVAPFRWEQAGAGDPAVPARKVRFGHFRWFEMPVTSSCNFEEQSERSNDRSLFGSAVLCIESVWCTSRLADFVDRGVGGRRHPTKCCVRRYRERWRAVCKKFESCPVFCPSPSLSPYLAAGLGYQQCNVRSEPGPCRIRPKAEGADSSRNWGNDTFDGDDRFGASSRWMQLKRGCRNVGRWTVYIQTCDSCPCGCCSRD